MVVITAASDDEEENDDINYETFYKYCVFSTTYVKYMKKDCKGYVLSCK